jgi:hypothetical protein
MAKKKSVFSSSDDADSAATPLEDPMPADAIPESVPESKLADAAPADAQPDDGEVASEPPPPPPPIAVPLDVFASACGKKWDQLAGFKLWAKNQGLKRLPMKEWKAQFETFLSRPISTGTSKRRK